MKLSAGRVDTMSELDAGRPGATGTQAVDRACALVDLVVRADEPLTFTDISDATGLARSTTSRLLAALERTALVQRDPSGAYVAGSLFALYAARHDRWQQTARVAMPHLERLRDRTGETAHLGVAQGSSVLHVAQADSAYLLGTRDWTNTFVPEHCSALGKVLLAAGAMPMPSGALERRTERTIADRDELAHALAVVRGRGYAVAVDELEVGLTAVAAPVRGGDGSVFAAIGVSGPTARLEDRVDQVGRLLTEQARDLSGLLRRKANTPHGSSRNTEGAA
jgi:DNA-binding IclR family transcriptional regulator